MIARFKHWYSDQRGITGLETAIILIAFVVVASVFAYTVLSAGIFSSERGKEAIHAGIDSARSSMEMVGPVVAEDTDDDDEIESIVFIVSNSLNGEAINLTETPNHTTVISYIDSVQTVNDIAWTATPIGRGDGDALLEPGEKFEIHVDVSALDTALTEYGSFTLEVKPIVGATMVIQRTLPAVINPVNSLN